MKSLLFTFLLLMLAVQVASAQIDYDNEFNRQKVAKFYKMKKAGTAMIVGGSALTVAGVALIASADWYTDNSGYNTQGTTTTDDPEGAFGILAVAVGVPLTAGGIVLAIIGSKKEKQYLKKISAGYFQKQGAHGLTIRMRL